MTQPLGLAVAGLGTVGAETVRILQRQQSLLAARAGQSLKVMAVSARDKTKDRGISMEGIAWEDNPEALAARPDVQLVVELMGGSEGPALALCKAALTAGKHVVTANKALIAEHGMALARLAEKHNAALHFEAAVAGGIPILKTLRDGMAANNVRRISGILNGTCNYILTQMEETGDSFDAILSKAQELGYAEADPTFDVDGIDTGHKLAILAALAYGCRVQFDKVHIEGIRRITPEDIAVAADLGYRIKLLGIAEPTPEGISQRVYPCLIDRDANPLAGVGGVFNAVIAEGDALGPLTLEGAGAGAGPTASAVIADIIDIARGRAGDAFGLPVSELAAVPGQPIEQLDTASFIRLRVVDRPGVLADIAHIFSREHISVRTLIQRGREEDGIRLILTTHRTREAAILRALQQLQELDTVLTTPHRLRIEA